VRPRMGPQLAMSGSADLRDGVVPEARGGTAVDEAGGTAASTWRVFVVLAAVYLVVVVVLGLWMADRNGGDFAYPLDDPYIHLAIADNLVHHGTWGIEPGVFESASSSPVWTVLLAAGTVALPVGDLWVPLVLTVASGLLLIWQIVRLDPFRRLGPAARWGGLVVACVPLGLLHVTFVGMEHLLHAALVLAIVTRVGALTGERAPPPGRWVVLGLLALATVVRFETLFLASGLAVALALTAPTGTRAVARVRRALPVVVASGIPLAGYAAVNIAFGQYVLPNSVVVKTSLADDGGSGPVGTLLSAETYRNAVLELIKAPEMTVLVAGVIVLVFATRRQPWAAWRVAGVGVVAATALNLLFGNLGWYGRYNIYLVAACYGVLFMVAADPPPELARARRRAVPGFVLALVIIAAPVQIYRASWLPTAGGEIYRQQGQMARFLAEHYDGQAVAVSDLGFVAWRHRGREVDLWGLASVDVVRALRAGDYGPAFMDELVERHDVQALAIYDSWFEEMRDGVPATWVPVEEWCLDDDPQRVVGGKCVTWYGPTEADAAVLRERLDADRSLPEGVSHRAINPS
jgi:hypothetical protein